MKHFYIFLYDQDFFFQPNLLSKLHLILSMNFLHNAIP